MIRVLVVAVVALVHVGHLALLRAGEKPIEPIEVRKVVADGKHNAFTALVRWKDAYWLSFRKAASHSSGDGDLIVLRSTDAKDWTQVLRLDVLPDDRDPQFLATEKRLFLYDPALKGGQLTSFVTYTDDGKTWSTPLPVYKPTYIFWKPVARGGKFYATAHVKSRDGKSRDVHLITSTDGLDWRFVSKIRGGNWESETTIHFVADDKIVAFLRQKYGSPQSSILYSSAPFTAWEEHPTPKLHFSGHSAYTFGGVHYFLTRTFESGRKNPGVLIYTLTNGQLNPHCRLPAGGDCARAARGSPPLRDAAVDVDGSLRRTNAQLAAARHRSRVGGDGRAHPWAWLSGLRDAAGSHRFRAATGASQRRDPRQFRRHAACAWQPPIAADVKAAGGRVRTVYSPLDAVALAKRQPDREIVFFAVGFETTAPATALAVKQADREGVDNFSLVVAHVRVQPAMEVIVQSPDNRVQAFLAAGHVCTVMGCASYEPFVDRYQLPVVVTGFEPLDLLEGVLACVRQLEAGESRVENQYARSVRREGNLAAQDIVHDVYEVCDRPWRGFGIISKGGLQLRGVWRRFDARLRFAASGQLPIIESEQCRSADVLARACTARMRSSEEKENAPNVFARCMPATRSSRR